MATDRFWRRRGPRIAALLCLGLALLLAFLPALLSRLLPGLLGAQFRERYQGELEVESVGLAWFARQSARGVVLRDPDGTPLARGRVELPSLWTWLAAATRPQRGELALTAHLEELVLSLDGEGRSNWELALAPRAPADRKTDPVGRPSTPSDPPVLPSLRLDLTVDALAVVAPGRAPLGAREVRGKLHHAAGDAPGLGALQLDLAGQVSEPFRGRLSVALGAPAAEPGPLERDPGQASPRGSARPPPSFEWSIEVLDVAALGRAFLAPPGGAADPAFELEELLGETALWTGRGEVRLPLDFGRDLGALPWAELFGDGSLGFLCSSELIAPKARAAFGFSASGSGLALEQPLRLALQDPGPLAAPGLFPRAPAMEWRGPLELDVQTLALPWPLPAGGLEPLAAALGGELSLRLWGFGAGLPSGEQARLSDLRVHVAWSPGGKPALRAEGQGSVGGDGPATPWTLSATLPALVELLRVPAAGPLGAELSLEGLPAGLVERFAPTRGLVEDLLGPSVDLRLVASDLVPLGPGRRGQLRVEAESALASLSAEGQWDGVGFSGGANGLELQFALTPLASPRVVGTLVPLVAAVRPTSEGQRARLRLEHFRLPLTGDLADLAGRLELDAGQVIAELFPGAAALLGGLLPEPRATALGPYVFELAGPRANYADLLLRIDGRPIRLSGSVGLLDRSISVRTEVPLFSLGGELGELVEKARGLLDPNTSVPVELTGTWAAPRIQLGASERAELLRTLERTLQKAAEDRLREEASKGLSDFLRRLRGGE